MSRFLSFLRPHHPVNIFGSVKPVAERNRWKDPDVRGPVPDLQIDLARRLPLTRPCSPSQRSSEGEPTGPPQCSLDKLPLEIRQQIWNEVIGGGRTFHLVLVGGRLKGPECLASDASTCDGGCRRLGSDRTSVIKSSKKFLLPLLLTSRQIYAEAVGILYSSNIFETHDANFLEFLTSFLLPQRINTIQSLVFTWRFQRYPPIGFELLNTPEPYQEEQDIRQASWNAIWQNLAAMENLRILRVNLDVRDAFWGSFKPDIAQMLLEPIKKVTTPKDFILTLPVPTDNTSRRRFNPWSAERTWNGVDPWDELPCTIRRVDRDQVSQF